MSLDDGNEAKDSLANILKQSDSKLRECEGMAMFNARKDRTRVFENYFEMIRFRTFLQVLFIRYQTLIGEQLFD